VSKKILFIVAHRPGRSPGQRFRFEQYLDHIQNSGFEFTYSYIISEKDDAYFYAKGKYLRKLFILLKSIFIRFKDLRRAKQYDIIFIYREALMLGCSWFEKRFKKKGAKIIIDYDDAIWLPDVSDGNSNLAWMKKPSKTIDIVKASDMVFAGNSYLADFAKQYHPNVKIVPTTLDTEHYQVRSNAKVNDGRLCIGWTGSLTTLKHFEQAVPFLTEIYHKFGNRVRFKMIADIPFITDQFPLEFCKWTKEKEVEDLWDINIGIMPLPDDNWAKGKCGFKGLQYMAVGIPSVMSPVGVNTEIITDGVNGFLASDDKEWITKISLLIESEELREKFGVEGRKTVEQHFSFNAWKDKYIQYFNEILA
jgi:glycosyltransferase involved in cell wall biosynthesis